MNVKLVYIYYCCFNSRFFICLDELLLFLFSFFLVIYIRPGSKLIHPVIVFLGYGKFLYSCLLFLLMWLVYMPFCFFVVDVFVCFYSDKDCNTMLTAVACTPISTFYLLYLFICEHIVVNIMQFYATVIQVKSLASYTTRFKPYIFYVRKCLYQGRNITVVFYSFDRF